MQNCLYVIYLLGEIRLVFHYQNQYKRISYQKTMEINPAYYRKLLIINMLTHLVNFWGYFSSGFILDRSNPFHSFSSSKSFIPLLK